MPEMPAISSTGTSSGNDSALSGALSSSTNSGSWNDAAYEANQNQSVSNDIASNQQSAAEGLAAQYGGSSSQSSSQQSFGSSSTGTSGSSSKGGGGINFAKPEDYCAIVDLIDGDKIRWQEMPLAVGYGKSANYDQYPIIGRSLPVESYGGSSPLFMNVTLRFIALESGGKNPSWVKTQVAKLESLTYPDYKGSITYPPHPVLVIVAQAFKFTGVVTQFGVNYTSPWDLESQKAFVAEVNLGIQEIQPNAGNKPYGQADIKGEVR